MTALEHAKRFIQRNAAKTALVIVPLALATQAQASPIAFDFAAADYQNTGLSPTAGAGIFSALPDGGVRFSGAFNYEVTHSGGAPTAGVISLKLLSGGGTGTLDMASIPAHFDFTYTLGFDPDSGNPFSNFHTSITYYINGNVAGSSGDLTSIGTSGDVNLAGWPLDDFDDLHSWAVDFVTTFDYAGDGTLALTIPPHSIDITPGAITDVPDVPEPASLALVTVGGLLVLIRRRSPRR